MTALTHSRLGADFLGGWLKSAEALTWHAQFFHE
jgi:hypothetical protein